jgi:cytochrome c553
MRHDFRTVSLIVGLWLGCGHAALGADKQPTAEEVRFFETSIRPLLVERCVKCHGPDEQSGGLRLDSLAAMLEGGASGPAIVPGQPGKSLLIKAVGQQDKLKMPKKGKLTEQQIADLSKWVSMGAPYPAAAAVTAIDIDKGRQFWAFQPPVTPAIPVVKDDKWAKSPLDHFTLAKLEAKGLRPAPQADKRTLIRRATFDLIGLPPTPQEIDAFVADDSAEAFAKVVDRLLASPQYGERWGRHWLDVARYADSNGLDENIAHGNAWRYRDYVVAAFSKDKPYDQFVLEQLAGDLLPNAAKETGRHERLIATGFLALGPKVLAEVDEKKMEMDIIDEQIDTVGRAFLGLTLGCARCHDHKFDPIPTEDYYALAGIFKSTRAMENFRKIARWWENAIATAEDRDRVALYSLAGAFEKIPAAVPSAMGVTEGHVSDAQIHVRGSHLKLGKAVPRHVPRVLARGEEPTFDDRQSGRLQLADWLVRPDHPLTSRVMVNRIWRWHFGQGIVRSTDNFGMLGERPCDPELLDWLAMQFVEKKWSVKAMHRLIMLSSTYQMSSAYDLKAAEIDPENRLRWRADVRRLEAEEIRDSLLAVGDLLDTTMGGSLLQVKNREFFFDHTSKDTTRYDSHRRAIYLPVVRNHVYDLFQLFDFPDPAVTTGDRATTTVAPQALFMMNSDLVSEVSESMAAKVLKSEKDDADRVQRLYRKAYGRAATAKEVERGLAHVKEVESALEGKESDAAKRRVRAWASLCHLIVAANEFIYVR